MAAFGSDTYQNCTSSGSVYGWKWYSCGCSFKDLDHPNRCTSVGGPCQICTEKSKKEENKE